MVLQVAVCGPAEATETERRAAEEVGELLARRGAVVLCGGGTGVMTAVASGAHRAGGLVVGVLPGTDASEAATGLSATVRTGLGEARNAVLVNSADAVVVIGGSWGTLSEQALAVRREGVPVIVLHGWQVVDADGHPVPGVTTVNSPADAVTAALAAVATSRPGGRTGHT